MVVADRLQAPRVLGEPAQRDGRILARLALLVVRNREERRNDRLDGEHRQASLLLGALADAQRRVPLQPGVAGAAEQRAQHRQCTGVADGARARPASARNVFGFVVYKDIVLEKETVGIN